MKEKLYTIPLNDAMNAGDECPFCFIERNVEQDAFAQIAEVMQTEALAVRYLVPEFRILLIHDI